MHRGIYFGCLGQEETFKRKCAGEQFIFIVKHLIVSMNTQVLAKTTTTTSRIYT